LSNGAINKKDNSGKTPIDYLDESEREKWNRWVNSPGSKN
jgi:hypothetical protein